MFKTLRDLGITVARREGQTAVGDLLRDAFSETYHYGIGIWFDAGSGRYRGVETKQFSATELNAVVYKEGPSNGCDPTCVSKFSGKAMNTVRRVGRALKQYAEWVEENHPESKSSSVLARIEEGFGGSTARAEADVQRAVDALQLGVENRAFVYVGTKTGIGAPLWTHEYMSDYLCHWCMDRYASYGRDSAKESCVQKNAVCSVCGGHHEEVFGNFSEFKTYILDKPGMIAGGFAVPQAARNFPVCAECAAYLSKGLTFAMHSLNFRTGGPNYLLLPQCHDAELRDLFLDLVEERKRDPSLAEKEIARLTEDENEVLDLIAERFGDRDRLTVQMLFYEEKQASQKIRAEIEHVLPSRIQQLFQTKQQIENRPWTHRQHRVQLSSVREFSGFSYTNSDRNFLAHVDAIFSGKQLPRAMVLRGLVDGILGAFRKDADNAWHTVARAFLLFDFYQHIGILNMEGGQTMATNASKDNHYAAFLQEHPQFFTSTEQRVAFLSGALVQCVTDAQFQRLKSRPFIKKLKGLRLSAGHLRCLLGEAKNKLHVYEADFYPSNRDLMSLLSEQWVAAGDQWNLSPDESTFYFTVGMNLKYHISQKYSGKQERN